MTWGRWTTFVSHTFQTGRLCPQLTPWPGARPGFRGGLRSERNRGWQWPQPQTCFSAGLGGCFPPPSHTGAPGAGGRGQLACLPNTADLLEKEENKQTKETPLWQLPIILASLQAVWLGHHLLPEGASQRSLHSPPRRVQTRAKRGGGGVGDAPNGRGGHGPGSDSQGKCASRDKKRCRPESLPVWGLGQLCSEFIPTRFKTMNAGL